MYYKGFWLDISLGYVVASQNTTMFTARNVELAKIMIDGLAEPNADLNQNLNYIY